MTEEVEVRHNRELEEMRAAAAGINDSLAAVSLGQDAAIAVEEAAAAAVDNPAVEAESGSARVSKAQRRRDAKARKDKERQEEIKRQEDENKFGPRQLEMDSITSRLKEK